MGRVCDPPADDVRVAVTGANGRLGRALITALGDAPFTGPGGPIGWTRTEFDLDAPDGVDVVLDRDSPEVVVHTAAWTDVDGCAREPELAIRRNAVATGVLAIACAERALDLVVISTNEVFDGARTDGRPYGPADEVRPINPYGVSKAKAEQVASDAFLHHRGTVGIVRTAWLYGPPGDDFPSKILAAAERARAAGERLRVVGDEYGSPTFAHDVAEAIAELIGSGDIGGVHHIVNAGVASRAEWAGELFRQARIDVGIDEVPASTWQRPSTPPRWGVLEPTPLPSDEPLRPWPQALADYLPTLLRQRAAAAS
jgi:dTDP-4-dehydrorhamnose reductase